MVGRATFDRALSRIDGLTVISCECEADGAIEEAPAVADEAAAAEEEEEEALIEEEEGAMEEVDWADCLGGSLDRRISPSVTGLLVADDRSCTDTDPPAPPPPTPLDEGASDGEAGFGSGPALERLDSSELRRLADIARLGRPPASGPALLRPPTDETPDETPDPEDEPGLAAAGSSRPVEAAISEFRRAGPGVFPAGGDVFPAGGDVGLAVATSREAARDRMLRQSRVLDFSSCALRLIAGFLRLHGESLLRGRALYVSLSLSLSPTRRVASLQHRTASRHYLSLPSSRPTAVLLHRRPSLQHRPAQQTIPAGTQSAGLRRAQRGAHRRAGSERPRDRFALQLRDPVRQFPQFPLKLRPLLRGYVWRESRG